MIIRNLTDDNDWTFGKGLQNYAREEQAVELNLKTRLQAYLTECFFDPELGVPWFNALGSKDKTIQESEKPIFKKLGKSLVSKYDIPSGTIIKRDMITTKGPGTGISPMKLNDIIGKETKVDINEDCIIKDSYIKW